MLAVLLWRPDARATVRTKRLDARKMAVRRRNPRPHYHSAYTTSMPKSDGNTTLRRTFVLANRDVVCQKNDLPTQKSDGTYGFGESVGLLRASDKSPTAFVFLVNLQLASLPENVPRTPNYE